MTTKKLIETSLPLEAINIASAREKTIVHGHPSTLHIWFARRPLAACRAVLFGQLVDDPGSLPDEFPSEEDVREERERLANIITDLVQWENINNEAVLHKARTEIARSVARNHGVKLPAALNATQVADALRQYAPPVLDPFCGGGSIPLEAQRLGLEAHGSDLNPVAVLITKALIEIPPRFANHPPVHPARASDQRTITHDWRGAQGLAEDVRYYGAWMRDEAQKRIGHLYPKAKLPGGGEATVIAWLWVRTVKCPNPACGAMMPLTSKWWLSSKKGKEVWAEPQIDHSQQPPRISFVIRNGGTPPIGTVNRKGAVCIVCNTPVSFDYIRAEGRAGRMSAQLEAVVADGKGGRVYLPPSDDQVAESQQAQPNYAPDTDLPEQALGFRVQLYGMTKHRDLFTPRQLVALTTFSDLVTEARAQVLRDAVAAGMHTGEVSLDDGGNGAVAYADAVATYLGIANDRVAMSINSLARWNSVGAKIQHCFGRQALPMIWDYADANVFFTSTGSWEAAIEMTINPLHEISQLQPAYSNQLDAASALALKTSLISTDPPYYDNIGYADLSDFFYVWLRKSIGSIYPRLFSTVLVPKKQELVATPYRFEGNREKAREFFEKGLAQGFTQMRSTQAASYPMAVYYAFKQTEIEDEEEDDDDDATTAISSTGWETMLDGLLRAGFQVTGTWPIRTEMKTRQVAMGANALASSIVLACRPRPENAPMSTRKDFLRVLRQELPAELKVLTSGRVAPVDLAQAAIGPGMAVYSRYSRVLEPDGSAMSIRTALQQINEVIQTYFAEREGELDSDTQFCLTWYKQYGTVASPYGVAETLSKAKNVSIEALVRAGLLKSAGGKVQLYLASADVYKGEWQPGEQRLVSIWEATHRLVAAHSSGGNQAAALVAMRLGAVGEQARDLAYQLYVIANDKGWAQEALGYNSMVAEWPAIREAANKMASQPTLFGA